MVQRHQLNWQVWYQDKLSPNTHQLVASFQCEGDANQYALWLRRSPECARVSCTNKHDRAHQQEIARWEDAG